MTMTDKPDIKKALEQVEETMGNALRQLGDVPLKPKPGECRPPIHTKGCGHMFVGVEIPVRRKDDPTPPKGDWEAEFERLHRQYFAILSLDCKRCGHNKDNHYWNGGGDSRNAGYDRCKAEDCKCIDYDEHADFVEVSKGYDTKYEDLKSFISSLLSAHSTQVKEEVVGIVRGMTIKENSQYDMPSTRLDEPFVARNVGYNAALGDVMKKLR